MGECNIILSDKRYEEIKETIVDLFVNLNINCTPISGFEVAINLGAKVIPYSAYSERIQELMRMESEDGFSIKTSNCWSVYYDDNRPYGRINNTLMHEVGHIVLDHTEDSELAEKEANFFAKYALAPPVLIFRFDLHNPSEVAERFGISESAAEFAWHYYQKWLRFGGETYKNYEIKLCHLFGLAG